jgi:hypothetical protein
MTLLDKPISNEMLLDSLARALLLADISHER